MSCQVSLIVSFYSLFFNFLRFICFFIKSARVSVAFDMSGKTGRRPNGLEMIKIAAILYHFAASVFLIISYKSETGRRFSPSACLLLRSEIITRCLILAARSGCGNDILSCKLRNEQHRSFIDILHVFHLLRSLEPFSISRSGFQRMSLPSGSNPSSPRPVL